MDELARKREDEYFARIEAERMRKVQEERRKQMEQEEKEKLKKLHHMRCPKCGMELTEVNFKGVKLDKCYACDGVWMDKGEMEAVVKLEKGTIDRLFSTLFT